MENENKKNYYNLLKSRIQICEAKKDEELQKQWQEDVEFEKKLLFKEQVQELYYDLFVDRILAKLIEEQIKKVTSEDDSKNKFKVKLLFYHSIDRDAYDFQCSYRVTKYDGEIYLQEPIKFSLSSCYNDYMSKNIHNCMYLRDRETLLELCHLAYQNLSLYFDVSDDFDKILTSYGKVERVGSCFSFECTLKELIDMYYMEKNCQKYGNYDARKKRK